MEKNEFYKEIEENFNELKIKLNEKQKEQFFKYMNLLIEWNKKINLTAITEPKDIIIKHFLDSVTISKYIKEGSYVVDIGTGAGFPGIPLKIIREDIDIVLVDSLNKRINFLNKVIENLNLKGIFTVHDRAEEFGRKKEYREKFDVVTSRAVANLSTLSEYLLPLAKINGKCICMKGPSADDEIEQAQNAIKILGGGIEKIDCFCLPKTDFGRTIIELKKVSKTNNKYPRKAGLPSKEPM